MISKVGSGFPAGSASKESACNVETQEGVGSIPGIREDPLEEELAPHSGNLAWEIP